LLLQATDFSVLTRVVLNPTPTLRDTFSSSLISKRRMIHQPPHSSSPHVSNGEIIITYDNSIIHVTSPDPYHTMVIWTLNEFDDSFFCGESCDYPLKESYLIKDGILTVKIFILDTYSFNATFAIVATETCTIKHCTFICMDYLSNFVCYSVFTQAILGVSFIASSLFIIYIIVITILWINCKLQNKFIVYAPADVPAHTVLIMCLICLITLSSAQCTTSSIVSTEIEVCEYHDGNYSCYFQLNQLIILPHLGNKVCIAFKSPQGDIIGNVNITYDLGLIKALTQTSYFTSDWNGLSCSDKSCSGSDYCTPSCVSDEVILNPFLSGICVTRPGKTTCRSSCGCAGCGCFFCSDACLTSRYSFLGVGLGIEVKDILSVRAYPRLVISAKINGTESTSVVDLYNNLVAGPFNIINIGSLDSSDHNFGDNKLVLKGSQSYLASSNGYNNPQFGKVGDIQASTSFAFGFPSPTAFIYPTTVVPSIETQDAVVYSFPSPGARLLGDNTELPMVFGDTIWSFDGSNLVGLNSNPGAVVMSLISTEDILLTYEKTRVCPNLDSLTINGCYNCPQGLTITVLADSLCDAGAVSVTIVTSVRIACFTSFTEISQTLTSQILQCTSNDKQISGRVIYEGDTTDFLDFSTILSEPPSLTQQEINDVFGNFTPVQSSFPDLWNSWTGSAAIAKYVIVVIMAIVIVISLMVIAYAGWLFYNKYSNKGIDELIRKFQNENYDYPIDYE
jgi:hypothetical protein